MKRTLAVTLFVTVGLGLGLGAAATTFQRPDREQRGEEMATVAADTYEHLATALIELDSTEDALVRSILLGYQAAADRHLFASIRDEQGRRGHLEAAAEQITNIANEGDKRIQAVRQRLLKAGITHNTDAESKEDYLFIDGREKKALLALAQKVAQLGDDAQPDAVRGVSRELSDLLEKALAPE